MVKHVIWKTYTDLFVSQRVHVGWAVDAQGGPRECKGWGTNCLANEENLEKRESTDMLSPVIRETKGVAQTVSITSSI